jgi:uncharacterized protein YprB with RNaseH-like and TPR domain
MIRNTFSLLQGIGQTRESALWRSGIQSWDEFLDVPRIKGISPDRKERMDSELILAHERLKDRSSSFFADRIRRREHWRCFKELGSSVAYVDIETTGLSRYAPVTVVGISDGKRTHTLVKGKNLNHSNLKVILSSATMLVTFNGSSFDLPIIEHSFPGAVPRVPHLDLRNALRRLGYVGGLKNIEREVGLERDRRVEYMTGQDAVYLWKLWERHGNVNALDLLVEYNACDCVNMRPLAELAYRDLRRMVFGSATGCKD